VTNLFQAIGAQKVFEIGGVKIGGRPGENPTVLIGTLFYHGHKIVRDASKGVFDRRKAEDLINLQDELSDKTGNPCMIDVVCASKEALRKYLDFVAACTDAPILMDGVIASNNIYGLEYARESGLIQRIIYNSLTPGHEPGEVEKIREVGLESAVLLAMNTKDFTARGRVASIAKLLDISTAVGINKPIIDTCVLDIATLGQACWALFELKTRYGIPVGCGAHNAVSGKGNRFKTKYGDRVVEPCTASANVMAAAVGADFLFYGPIETADYIFPAVGIVDAGYGQILMDEGIRLERTHPRFSILRKLST
jgi:tetrahydromethanopterin S-methyltransferase subunit H